MKGLLVKDFRYVMGQKTSLLIFVGLGLYFLFTGTDVSFALVFSMMMAAIFSTSSISYDSFENGMSFLLTLPVQRKTYVVSKYLFSLLVVAAMGVIISVLALVCSAFGMLQVELSQLGGGIAAAAALAVVMLVVMVPIYIIFGGEKARVAILTVYGIVFAGAFLITKVADGALEKLAAFAMRLKELGAMQLGLLATGVLVILLAVSVVVTIKVVEKKEY